MVIICDLDGTVSDHAHRLPFVTGKKRNYDAYYQGMGSDTPLPGALKHLLDLVWRAGPDFFFLTGRPEQYRQVTTDWLKGYFGLIAKLPHEAVEGWNEVRLIMRPDGDYRPATVFKEEFSRFVFSGGTNLRRQIIFIDDDLRNETMYKKYGIFLKAPECWEVLR